MSGFHIICPLVLKTDKVLCLIFVTQMVLTKCDKVLCLVLIILIKHEYDFNNCTVCILSDYSTQFSYTIHVLRIGLNDVYPPHRPRPTVPDTVGRGPPTIRPKKSCLVRLTRPTLKNWTDPFFLNFGAAFPVFHKDCRNLARKIVISIGQKKNADLSTLF